MSVFLVALAAGGFHALIALAGGIFGGLFLGIVHVVCGVIAAVRAADNANLRADYEEKRARPPSPASSAVPLQPTAVVFRF